MARCTAVIFDLDGTLLDTEQLYLDAAREVLEPYGIEYGLEQHRQLLKTNTRTGSARLLENSALSVDVFMRQRRELVRHRYTTISELPGVTAFLQLLDDGRLPIGLVSNASRDESLQKLGAHAWGNCFGAKVFGDDSRGLKLKPSSDMYLACAADLGANPSECVAFEDSPVGVEAALAAGMQVFAVRSTFVDSSDIRGASFIDGFEQPADLISQCGLAGRAKVDDSTP